MTTPAERTRATLLARDFLLDLLDPKKTPHVPKAIRTAAARISKHFPGTHEIRVSGEAVPDAFDPAVVVKYLVKKHIDTPPPK